MFQRSPHSGHVWRSIFPRDSLWYAGGFSFAFSVQSARFQKPKAVSWWNAMPSLLQDIGEQEFDHPEEHVFGSLFLIGGESGFAHPVPTHRQRIPHVPSGSLYFDCCPIPIRWRRSSIISKEIRELMQSLNGIDDAAVPGIFIDPMAGVWHITEDEPTLTGSFGWSFRDGAEIGPFWFEAQREAGLPSAVIGFAGTRQRFPVPKRARSVSSLRTLSGRFTHTKDFCGGHPFHETQPGIDIEYRSETHPGRSNQQFFAQRRDRRLPDDCPTSQLLDPLVRRKGRSHVEAGLVSALRFLLLKSPMPERFPSAIG